MKIRFLFPILTMSLLGSAAIAQSDQATHTNRADMLMRELIDLLGEDTWVSRDQAMIDLARLADEIPFSQLESYLQDPTLTLEQRTRIYQACMLRFHIHPKAGLGVAFGNVQVGAIELQPIQNDPRFPASKMLNPGDLLAKVEGQIVSNSFDVRAQILSREPGDSLPVTIIRANRVLNLDLPLGSFTQLTGAARVDPPLAQRALSHRWERAGIVVPTPDVIGTQINLDQWISAAFPAGVTPDPHVPVRRMSNAIISGWNQRAMTGYPQVPATRRPYMSPDLIEQRAQAVELKYHGYDRQLLDAQVRILTIEKTMANTELEVLVTEANAVGEQPDDSMTKHLHGIIDKLNQQIDELQEQLDSFAADEGGK